MLFFATGFFGYFGLESLRDIDREYSHHFQAELEIGEIKSSISHLQVLFHKFSKIPVSSIREKDNNLIMMVDNYNKELKDNLSQLMAIRSQSVFGIPGVKSHFFESKQRMDEHLQHILRLSTKILRLTKSTPFKKKNELIQEFDLYSYKTLDRMKPVLKKISENRKILDTYKGYFTIFLVSFGIVALSFFYSLIYLPWIKEYQNLEMERVRLQDVLQESEVRGSTFSWEVNYETKETKRSNHLSGIFEQDEENEIFYLYDEVALFTPESQSVFMTAIENCVDKGDPLDVEVSLYTKNQKNYWLRYFGKRVEVNGIVHIKGTVRDITDQKLAQKRFASLFENLSSPSLVFGEGQIKRANDAALKFFGVDESDELDKLHPAILFPLYQMDGQSSLEKLKKAMVQTRQGKTINEDWTFQTRFGKDTVGVVTLFSIPFSEIDQYLMIITDNRQKYEFERRLVDANRMALHARRSKLEYVTQMGLVLQELTDLVKEEISNQKQAETGHEEKLLEVQTTLENLWRENLSQGLEEGSHIVLTDLRKLVSSLEKRWLSLALEKKNQFILTYSQGEDELIWIDSSKLRLALMTLVESALSFGENENIEFKVDINFSAGRFGKATFSVLHSSENWPGENWQRLVVENRKNRETEEGGVLSLNSLLKVIEILQGEFFIGSRKGNSNNQVGFQCSVERALGITLEEINDSSKANVKKAQEHFTASDIWAHFGGDWDIIETTITDFLDYYPGAIADMYYYLKEKNGEELNNLSSDLYGVLSHFPFFIGLERIIKIQKYSKYLKFEKVEEELEALSLELSSFCVALQKYLPEEKSKSA